jgi:hypothetical protein
VYMSDPGEAVLRPGTIHARRPGTEIAGCCRNGR